MARTRRSYQLQGSLIARKRKTTPSARGALTTSLAGANNDLVFTAASSGASALTIAYVVAGNNTPLTVVKTGDAVTVNVATGAGGAATSTALQVRDAVNTTGAVDQFVEAELAPGNDGSGIVTAMSATPLGGGA
jgi:hypothetical protein